MPRHERLDFKDAIHYARVRGRDGSAIFFDADILRRFPEAPRQCAAHVQKFELLLADACTVYGAVLHAYCVEPNSGILVLQRAGAPLHALMRRLCGRYSRYLRAIGFVGGRGVFGARYDSKVVAPEYLPHVVRHAHRSPVLAGLCRRVADYPFSSARAYAGDLAPIPVALIDLRNALEAKGLSGPRGYREFMNEDEPPNVAKLLSCGSPLDSRVVGDKVFVQKARHMAAHPVVPPTREQLIEGVARLLNKTPADVFSATHVGALGRSLVAWYGVRSGAATLNSVGRWFSVSAATLGQGIRRHRGITPELFDRALMPGLGGGTGDKNRSASL
jgi:REP-associated tyrosine transposase